MSAARIAALMFLAGLVTVFGGCKSTYYSAWEKLGWEKRDILVDRVKDARDDQEQAKQQFKTTLEQFQAVTNFQGGDLEAKYKKLSSAYDDSESKAKDVTKRINSVESVATDLFKEWEAEIGQYTNADLKRSSQQKLTDTRTRYQQLLTVMRQAEQKMQPVLAAFKDQVLYLKHNLNAQAISSLQTTAAGIQQDVDRLIKEMEASIAEANAFISQMSAKS